MYSYTVSGSYIVYLAKMSPYYTLINIGVRKMHFCFNSLIKAWRMVAYYNVQNAFIKFQIYNFDVNRHLYNEEQYFNYFLI